MRHSAVLVFANKQDLVSWLFVFVLLDAWPHDALLLLD